jgi:hypothetical protein
MARAIFVVLLGIGLVLAGAVAINNGPPVQYTEQR